MAKAGVRELKAAAEEKNKQKRDNGKVKYQINNNAPKGIKDYFESLKHTDNKEGAHAKMDELKNAILKMPKDDWAAVDVVIQQQKTDSKRPRVL